MKTTISGGSIQSQAGDPPGPDRGPRSSITISGDVIEAVSDDGPGLTNRVDATGLIVSPGFIDLQINGGFGADLAVDPGALWELGRRLPRHGVTGFLPTIITSPPSVTAAAMTAIGQRPADHLGAEPLGLHFEGPMLSPFRPGAHPRHHLVAAGLDVIADWSPGNGVALVTIAPELAGAPTVIGELVGRGVAVSAGHSEATAEQARAGIEAGVTLVTHLFNAMSPLGHRDPNLVGVALADPALSVSVIVDGVHLAPEIVATIWKAKGPEGLVLITDAVAAMGMGPGIYQLGGVRTTADERQVRTDDGVLAGSILSMDQAIRNLMACTGCDVADALRTATATPARIIGLANRGRIEPGAVADLVLLDPSLEVQATFCRGRLAHIADSARSRVPQELLETL